MAHEGLRNYLKTRELINKTFLVILIMVYASFYFLFMPNDTPYTSMIFTSLAIPLLVFPFYYKASSYIFMKNWFYPFYLLVSTFFFLYSLTFVIREYGDKAGVWEFYHVIACVVFGYATAIIVSLPFKVLNLFLFDATEFYYEGNMIDLLDKKAYPEKYAKEEEKKKEVQKEQHKYDLMNETQLHAEHTNALKEERYEDAAKIKKILDTKFR